MHVKCWSLAPSRCSTNSCCQLCSHPAYQGSRATWKSPPPPSLPPHPPQSPEALSGQRTAPSWDLLLHPQAAVKTPPPAPFCIEKGSEETMRGKAGAQLSYPPHYCDQAFNPFLSRRVAGTHPGPAAHLPTSRDGSQQTPPALGGSRARP